MWLTRKGLQLHQRPWHWKYRLNVSDHFLGRYNTAMDALLPDDLIESESAFKEKAKHAAQNVKHAARQAKAKASRQLAGL